jgi:CheY-like chemotaxis protein
MKTSSEDVLLIEGDLKLAKAFSEALEEEEIHCCVALEANAVTVASAWQPRLILLDAGSYRMEGLTALEDLRRNKFTAALPIIVLSGNTDRYVIERLRAHGIVDYWALQELSPEMLVRRVRRWFNASPKATSHPGVGVALDPRRN